MKWAVQTTLIDLDTGNQLGDAAINCGCELVPVWIQPFANELPDMDVSEDEPVIFYGSTKLIELVSAGNFYPGVWYTKEAFNYKYHIELNGDMMLNSDAQVCRLGDYFHDRADPFFARPLGDLKQFSGKLIESSDDLREWQKRLSMAGLNEYLETEILVAEPKNIEVEYRCFVVNNKVIDATEYRSANQTRYQKISQNMIDSLEDYLLDAIMPMDIIVADIAVLPSREMKIIEFNCFNASGFYKHDIPKVVRAVTDHAIIN